MRCFKTFIYLSAFIVSTRTYKLSIPYALMCLHTIRDALELNADNTLEGFPPLYPGGHGVCDHQQECHIWTRLTRDQFPTLKWSILNESWSTGHDGASGPGSNMTSFLHDGALVGFCRWHSALCLLTVVGSIPGPI